MSTAPKSYYGDPRLSYYSYRRIKPSKAELYARANENLMHMRELKANRIDVRG